MTCEAVPFMWAVYAVVAAVFLAMMSPKAWHDVGLDVVRRKFDAGPGGSATEEEEEEDA